ncbi:hypothetical protein DEO72_LG7g2060 [Vigna unguiculata]|uniref:Uncharacterized protein n=1 Tax=Vigna unguiculata TaxID=3917 RepID=A0A4D6MH03_VIGUN|nr:hypothetical protein DEO72_LG7g2060 [Vigna unguiculata]
MMDCGLEVAPIRFYRIVDSGSGFWKWMQFCVWDVTGNRHFISNLAVSAIPSPQSLQSLAPPSHDAISPRLEGACRPQRSDYDDVVAGASAPNAARAVSSRSVLHIRTVNHLRGRLGVRMTGAARDPEAVAFVVASWRKGKFIHLGLGADSWTWGVVNSKA